MNDGGRGRHRVALTTRGIDRGAIRPSYLVHVHPHVANGAGAATKSSVVSGRVAVTGDQINVLLVLDDQETHLSLWGEGLPSASPGN